MRIGKHDIGPGHPCYVIAEIGQNHNGDLELAKRMIREAAACGVNAVKFQKRTLEICVPEAQRDEMRDTPWGRLRYIDYRRKLEFDERAQWEQIDRESRAAGIDWFASSWDSTAVEFVDAFAPVAHKVASATVSDLATVGKIASTGRPMIVSTGATDEITLHVAWQRINRSDDVALLHCNSTYPCAPADVNLRCMETLAGSYPGVPVGYSGHETGLQISLAAVALGACIIERHFTLDRAMWGTDQAASLEPAGMRRLVRDIRVIEQAMGDGVKRITDGERAVMKKLRRVM